MSPLADFYLHAGMDPQGRTLVAIQQLTDSEMESGHDFIQWMFPLRTRSKFNPKAPTLTTDDLKLLRDNFTAREHMMASLNRIRRFLGLPPAAGSGRSELWATGSMNHNLRRITRVITSLRLFGLHGEATQFYDDVLRVSGGRVPANSKQFWADALHADLTAVS